MRRFVFLVVLLAAACDRSPSEPPGRPSTVAREPVRRAPTVQDTSYRLPGGDRIVAFKAGRVHFEGLPAELTDDVLREIYGEHYADF